MMVLFEYKSLTRNKSKYHRTQFIRQIKFQYVVRTSARSTLETVVIQKNAEYRQLG